VFDEEQLRNMSSEDRLRLLRTLAEIDSTSPVHTSPGHFQPGPRRRRMLVLTLIAACCIILAAWTGVLAATLPMQYRAGGWRGAWVGFDIALLIALLATGWAAWHGRQVLIMCLTVVATLLLCDAWFDVVLDARTRGFGMSLVSALVVEVPLAVLSVLGARRLLRLSLGRAGLRGGTLGRRPSLWRMPLFGGEPPAAEMRELQPHFAQDGQSAGSAGTPPAEGRAGCR
jgi:hypothetical protein